MNYITNTNPEIKVKIPHNTVEILKILIKNASNEFDNISSNLQKIIEDNKIDFKDIPEFMHTEEPLDRMVLIILWLITIYFIFNVARFIWGLIHPILEYF